MLAIIGMEIHLVSYYPGTVCLFVEIHIDISSGMNDPT
jgi:hypothetical protein